MGRAFAFLFCSVAVAAATPISIDSIALPALSEDVAAALARQTQESALSDCFEQAYAVLVQDGCKELDEPQKRRLAIWFANCHLESTGRPNFPCPTNYSLKECGSAMSSEAYAEFSAYTRHVDLLCYSYESRRWRTQTAAIVERLMLGANASALLLAEVVQKSDALREQNMLALAESERAHVLSSQLVHEVSSVQAGLANYAFSVQRTIADTQTSYLAISDVLQQLSSYTQAVLAIQGMIARNLSFLQTISYYLLAGTLCWALSSTQRTAGSRFWLFVGLLAAASLELLLISRWSYISELSAGFHVMDLPALGTWRADRLAAPEGQYLWKDASAAPQNGSTAMNDGHGGGGVLSRWQHYAFSLATTTAFRVTAWLGRASAHVSMSSPLLRRVWDPAALERWDQSAVQWGLRYVFAAFALWTVLAYGLSYTDYSAMNYSMLADVKATLERLQEEGKRQAAERGAAAAASAGAPPGLGRGTPGAAYRGGGDGASSSVPRRRDEDSAAAAAFSSSSLSGSPAAARGVKGPLALLDQPRVIAPAASSLPGVASLFPSTAWPWRQQKQQHQPSQCASPSTSTVASYPRPAAAASAAFPLVSRLDVSAPLANALGGADAPHSHPSYYAAATAVAAAVYSEAGPAGGAYTLVPMLEEDDYDDPTDETYCVCSSGDDDDEHAAASVSGLLRGILSTASAFDADEDLLAEEESDRVAGAGTGLLRDSRSSEASSVITDQVDEDAAAASAAAAGDELCVVAHVLRPRPPPSSSSSRGPPLNPLCALETPRDFSHAVVLDWVASAAERYVSIVEDVEYAEEAEAGTLVYDDPDGLGFSDDWSDEEEGSGDDDDTETGGSSGIIAAATGSKNSLLMLSSRQPRVKAAAAATTTVAAGAAATATRGTKRGRELASSLHQLGEGDDGGGDDEAESGSGAETTAQGAYPAPSPPAEMHATSAFKRPRRSAAASGAR